MSFVVKAVKKVFKAVTSIFKKVPILKAIVVAAAIWFTAGAALAYFGPAAPSLLGAMQASATSMWSTVSTALGVGAPAAAGGGSAALGGSATLGAGTAAANGAAALGGSSALGTVGAGVGGAAAAAAPVAAAAPGIVGSAMGWVAANPTAAVMAGSALSSGFAGKQAAEDAQKERDWRSGKGAFADMTGHEGDFGVRPDQQPVQTVAPQVVGGQSAQSTPAQRVRPGMINNAMLPPSRPPTLEEIAAQKAGAA